jgi:autotransporter-associated beta strand protein
MKRNLSAIFGLVVASTLSLPTPANAQYVWTGAVNGIWNNGPNWSAPGGGIPNSPTATVTFGGLGLGTINIATSVSTQSLTFSNPTGAYTLTSSANQTLSRLTSITVDPAVTGTQTINLANVSTGSLLFTGTGNGALTISNNVPFFISSLVIGPNTVIGTPGSGGISVIGSGATLISGSFTSNPSNQVVGGLTYEGSRSPLTLSGNGASLFGGITVASGFMGWDYFTNTAPKFGGGNLQLFDGGLTLSAHPTIAVTQNVPGGSTTINTGDTEIYLNTFSGTRANITLNAGALSRVSTGTLNVRLESGATMTTTTGLTNGILGPWAVVNGQSWASKSGSNIVGLSTYGTDVYAPGMHTDVTTGSGIPSGFTTSTLRFNTPVTAVLSGTNTIQSGGILVSAAGHLSVITGGTLTSGTNEFIVHTHGGLTINSAMTLPGGLTLADYGGGLTLGGPISWVGGVPLTINYGTATFTNPLAFDSLSEIRFNDRSDTNQQLRFALPDGQDGASGANIHLTGHSALMTSNYNIAYNAALNSRITLSGVISTQTGFSALYFGGASEASGFNLTGANTFTGDLRVGAGVLGIASDANLGNAANAVILTGTSFNAGGLEFLNDGTRLAHSLRLDAGPGRVIVTGANTNAIDSAITGTGFGTLTKVGAGTLILNNAANTYSGGTVVNEGRLQLGAGAAIPPNTNVAVSAGAEFNTAGLSNSPASAIGTVTLNGGTFRVPSGNGDYYLNKLATGTTGGTVDFTGSSNFWLHLVNPGASITVGGNSTWIGAPASHIQNDTAAPIDINIANNSNFVTLTNGIILANGINGQGFRLTGPAYVNNVATMVLTNSNNTADLIADSTGYLQVADMVHLGSGSLTLQNTAFDFRPGTLWYTGPTVNSGKPIALGVGGGQIYTFTPGTNLTLSGVISESSALSSLQVTGAYDAPSTLTLTADNMFTGGVNIRYMGILSIGSITDGGVTGPLGASSSAPYNLQIGTPFLRGGTLQYTGPTATTDRGVALVASFESFTNVNAIEVTNPATNLTFTGQFTGSGGLSKAGPGTLTLGNATNDYAAGTFVNEGRLALGSGTAIPVGGNVTVAAGATFDTGGLGNSAATAIGIVALNGGVMRAASSDGTFYWLNKLTTAAAGLNASGATGFTGLAFVNAGAGITVNGNSAWTGPSNFALINASGGAMPITIAPGVTLTTGLSLAGFAPAPSSPFRITGGGTLYQTNTNDYIAYVRVDHARLRRDDLSDIAPGYFDLTLDNGTLAYGGPTAYSPAAFAIGTGGGTVEVVNAATTLTISGAISGTGSATLTKSGPGTLALTNTANSYIGGLIVNAGRLDVSDDAQLGAANPVINPAGTLRYTANATTARSFTLFNGSLDVSSGATLALDGANVYGGFLRGPGTYDLTGGASLTGVTTFTSTTINQTGAASIANFANNGSYTVGSGQTLTLSYGTNASAGRFNVNGTANVADFVSNGRLSINPGGTLNSTQGGMVVGGGSVTNIGIYNPSDGQVTPGGTLNFGAGDMRVQGGFVRNNGTITGTGDLVIDFAGVVKGAGEIDTPRAPIRINGGQLLAGNSPGLTRVVNFSLVSTGVTGGDFSNATGIAGPPIGSTGTQLSGFSVFEYGNSTNTGGSARVEGTPASRAIWQFRTVVDGGDYSTAGVPANFNAAQSYTWGIVRPRSAADVGNPNNITPINTVAQLSIFDTATMTTVALDNTNLNSYLRFDDSAWNWGSVPVDQRGMFAFVLLPDALGAPNRVIALTYAPVPEATYVLTAAILGIAGFGVWRRHFAATGLRMKLFGN